MKTAQEIIKEYNAQYPIKMELWKAYHVENKHVQQWGDGWSYFMLYEFNKEELNVGKIWLEIHAAVVAKIQSQEKLKEVVEIVPFYLSTDEVFIQPKPPYDGGYSLSHYHEFLEDGNCMPNTWILDDINRLHQAIIESDLQFSYEGSSREGIIDNIIHATLVGDNSDLFWNDEEPWSLYLPVINMKQIKRWKEFEK